MHAPHRAAPLLSPLGAVMQVLIPSAYAEARPALGRARAGGPTRAQPTASPGAYAWLLSRARAGPAARPGGRARLDGELAVSRALGDAPYRGRGLSAEPELAPWLALGPADAALLLASDGVLEALPAAAACRITHAVATGAPIVP